VAGLFSVRCAAGPASEPARRVPGVPSGRHGILIVPWLHAGMKRLVANTGAAITRTASCTHGAFAPAANRINVSNS